MWIIDTAYGVAGLELPGQMPFFSTEKHGARQQLNLKSGSGEYREININCKIVCIYI